MKKWNEYYESMDPKNQHSSKTQIKTPLSQVRSVFPRHRPAATASQNSNHQYPSAEAPENFQMGRYIQRRSDVDSNLRRTDGGNTNFAWVD